MEIEIYLVRHGECVMNLDRSIIGGRAMNSPLTEKGFEQARILGYALDKMGHINPSRVYSSTAVRAMQTARTTMKAMGLYENDDDIVFTDQLVELDQGNWMGCKRDEKYTDEVMVRIKNDPSTFRPPYGESQRDVLYRASNYIYEQLDKSFGEADNQYMFFAHGYVIRCFLWGITNWNPNLNYRVLTENCGVTKLTYDNGLWALKYFNRVVGEL